MLKRILAAGLTILLLTVSALAEISEAEILTRNAAVSQEWVNWYPSNWRSDADIKSLAEHLKEEGTLESLPLRIHDWICDNILYDWDAYYADEYSFLSSGDVLRKGKGVCEAIANLTQALFLEADIPCIKVWGVAIPENVSWNEITLDLNRVNHTWNEYYAHGHWITLDCTEDIKNYEERAHPLSPKRDYFNPTEDFFAKTHLRLIRGSYIAAEEPSAWAKEEITRAVDKCYVPISILFNYQAPIRKSEFEALLGISSEHNDQFLTRLEAAVVTAQTMDTSFLKTQPIFYEDTYGRSLSEQIAMNTLYYNNIMHGNGAFFYPDRLITRQEAIVVVERLLESGTYTRER